MGFFYEYTMQVVRPSKTARAGLGAYSASPGENAPIATNLPASVQRYRIGHGTETKLPGDVSAPDYNIIMPFSAVPTLGMIRERDVLVDNLGRRFQVIAMEWTMLGFSAHVMLLET